ncbi:hypothetical protein ACIRSS_17965 [Amycolatopsis sp. NPDC101161]|uniref:hypothetical protein n=1 Tax=Amycolatopsis sp. NPDC101161 TaxID=3363940 RepID=UPI003813807D
MDTAGPCPGVLDGALGLANDNPATNATVTRNSAVRASAEKEQTTIMTGSSEIPGSSGDFGDSAVLAEFGLH